MTFNDVYAACPLCKREYSVEIPQVILGLGDFYLDKLQDFVNEFSDEDLETFVKLVEKERFHCDEHGFFSVKLVEGI